jgi:hypothetical protein
MIENESVIP